MAQQYHLTLKLIRALFRKTLQMRIACSRYMIIAVDAHFTGFARIVEYARRCAALCESNLDQMRATSFVAHHESHASAR